MKKPLLTLLFILMVSTAQAQCVAEIKNVKQDSIRGSIIVETQYVLNGKVIIFGKNSTVGTTRYDEQTGTNVEIKIKINRDIDQYCEALIKRIKSNEMYINAELIKQQKALTRPIIAALSVDIVGLKRTKTEAIISFKGKDINVKANGITSIINTP